MIDIKNVKDILIIQTAFLGDLILTLPVIQVLKEKIPCCKITLMCIPDVSNLVVDNPLIDDLIIYDKHNNKSSKYFFSILKEIKSKNFDLLISPHRSFRTTFISVLSRIKNRITFEKSDFSFLYNYIVKYEKNKHEILRNLDLLKPMDIEVNEIIKPELYIPELSVKKIEELLLRNNINGKFICIAPGSVWFTKQFPKEKFVTLINGIQNSVNIFLIGGNKDIETGEFIISNSKNKNIINTIGKLSVLESAELIRRSEVLLTNDSAPLHLGNAVDTKVIAIFGSTIPAFGFYPYGKNDEVIEIKNLYCRPCGIHGYKVCPEKHFRCMLDINEMEIAEKINAKF